MRAILTAVLAVLMLGLVPLPVADAQSQPTATTAAPQMATSTGWQTVRTMNVRSGPSTQYPIVGELKASTKLDVLAWQQGEIVVGSNDTWAKIADGRFVYSNGLVKPKPDQPPAPGKKLKGRWIDVNLSQQVITAYSGDTPVYWAVMSSGRPGWETPTGTLTIQRRKIVTVMDSSNLNAADTAKLRADAQQYRVEDVFYTQYFTDSGDALHYNYWKWDTPFGMPTSHGCIGMNYSDSYFFWAFATLGTPLVIHY
ncbi:MAG: L,D-transpeptidase family protein [Chloroflexi bacterium]|nr:L,D-transpeptidase family protein [Chloroflexota bacterium]